MKLIIVLFMVLWLVVTAAALLFGFRYDWPDNVHVNYGSPLTWSTNTVSTFAGPANLWDVNISNLLVDLVIWLSIMIAAVGAILFKLKD
jgi:hypothetical protein